MPASSPATRPSSRPASRRPLTTRIVIAFTGFGAILSVFMAAFVLGAFIYTERQHLNSLVADEMSYLRESGRTHAAVLDTMSLYQGPADTLREELPPDVRSLGVGTHRLDAPARLVAVEQADGILRVVSMSFEPVHGRQRSLLLVLGTGVLLAIYGSAWAGFWLARRIVEPVRSLADRVERRDVDAVERMAEGNADDEVGALARSFDAYEARIRDLLERERRVTDQASHELRTPITVITGAAELLLADETLTMAARQRVARIRRAAIEMAELVETFLLLAREPEEVAGAPRPGRSLAALVREVIDSQAIWLEGKPVELRLEVEEDGPLREPERLLAIVVANLVRNACQYTERGSIEVRVRSDGIDVLDTGPGLGRDSRTHAFSAQPGVQPGHRGGLGLPLVRALCERQGWSVSLSARPGGGTIAALRFEGGTAGLHATFTSA